ncbi:MAG: hypothetical protein JKY61_13005 [Planctomycetes bacterium]|nr:hypothetical protein [Planctomycetota bacterium]
MSPRLRTIEVMYGEPHTNPIEFHPQMLYLSQDKCDLEAGCPKAGELGTYRLSKVRNAIPQ